MAETMEDLMRELQEADNPPPVKEEPQDVVVEADDTQDVVDEQESVEEEVQEDEEADAVGDDAKARARAFARMRHEKKELMEKLEAEARARQELSERLARMEGRLEATPKKEEPLADQEPDKDLYPEDWNTWKINQLEKQVATFGRTAQEIENERKIKQALDYVGVLEKQAEATLPDYGDAINFLIEKEKAVERLANPSISEAELERKIMNAKLQLFSGLKQQDPQGNPATRIYEIAKAYGYTPNKKATAPKKDLEKIAENQRRSANLMSGSQSGKPRLTQDDVFNIAMKGGSLSDKDYEAFLEG